MPTKGRYKVYIIDEVHMLSTHSFNALLKTLEEPPEHVKFLLATTDPQKLPVTVLSRCLQFHLKNLSNSEIQTQLTHILAAEKVSAEDEALALVSQQSDGSMRDALSLIDQAIAYSPLEIHASDIRKMLGTANISTIINIVKSIAQQDFTALMPQIEKIQNDGGNFQNALTCLAEIWHTISLYQATGQFSHQRFPAEDIVEFAKTLTPQILQLFYQITIKSQQDIHLAPNGKIGFEMATLRMVAFTPNKISNENTPSTHIQKPSVQKLFIKPNTPETPPKQIQPTSEIKNDTTSTPNETTPPSTTAEHNPNFNWHEIAAQINLKGPAKQLILNSTLSKNSPDSITIAIDPSFQAILSENLKSKIASELKNMLNPNTKVYFETPSAINKELPTEPQKNLNTPQEITPAAQKKKTEEASLETAFNTLQNDPIIRELCNTLDTKVEKQNIRLYDKPTE